jgi:two-component system C4-dicarboxylate transport sensor histidine kinase DctB
MVSDVGKLRQLEEVKGVLSLSMTAGLLFVATFAVLTHAERAATEVARQREVIVAREREALAGLMVAAIAHDANNVLAALSMDLSVFERAGSDAEGIKNARASVERLAGLNRRLIEAGRQSSAADICDLELKNAVEETLGVLRFHHALAKCQITVTAKQRVVVRANPILVHQVLSNLVINAGEVTSGKGRIELTVLHDETTDAVVTHIDDDGPGVPLDRRADLFSALKTTKPRGNGLGLYSARACALVFGGRIEVSDSPLGGARFSLFFPAARRVSAASVEARDAALPARSMG